MPPDKQHFFSLFFFPEQRPPFLLRHRVDPYGSAGGPNRPDPLGVPALPAPDPGGHPDDGYRMGQDGR